MAKEKAPKVDRVENKDKSREIKKAKDRFIRAEENLEKLNSRKSQLEAALASPDIYGDKTKFLETESAYSQSLGL